MASEQHKKFQTRLIGSSLAVGVVGAYLNSRGKNVEMPKLRVSPTAADAGNYLDDGDLYIVEKKRVEVKWSSKNFTGSHDYPYPTMLISNVAAVDRAKDVSAWFIVSQDYTHAAIVLPQTREHWKVVEILASNTGNLEKDYAVGLEHVKFCKLQWQ